MSTIGILVFDGAEELDFVGPWEVLTASSALLEKDGAPPDRVMLVAERLDPVRRRKGMRVLRRGHPPRLAELGADVVRDVRWVRDGNVVSSQGVSAGIDMALWLVGQLHSPAHARATQRYIQYEPAPPYAADV
jgi:transcriptional regulator GlxA family with amidase domain